jgi:hypothetical protein
VPPPPHEPVNLDEAKQADLVPRLREMLKQRESLIKAEQQQVRLVEAKNEALRANLDQVRGTRAH